MNGVLLLWVDAGHEPTADIIHEVNSAQVTAEVVLCLLP
jgi:hypothetical protein